MKTNTSAPTYKGFRFPPEIISHAVWLCFRFSLSFLDIEELLAQRGILVTYEMVRQWCLRFGQPQGSFVPVEAILFQEILHVRVKHDLARFLVVL